MSDSASIHLSVAHALQRTSRAASSTQHIHGRDVTVDECSQHPRPVVVHCQPRPYIRTCAWPSLACVPVAGWSPRPSPPSSHLATAATAAWRLIRVSFQAILLRGGRLTARSLHHSSYLWARSRSRAAAATGLLSTLKLRGACLLAYMLPSPVSAHPCLALLPSILHTTYYTLHTTTHCLPFRLPPQHAASIDALAHKRNQPSPTLADGLISRTDSVAHGLMDTPSKYQPPKPRHPLPSSSNSSTGSSTEPLRLHNHTRSALSSPPPCCCH
jgi:hypothetical protein